MNNDFSQWTSEIKKPEIDILKKYTKHFPVNIEAICQEMSVCIRREEIFSSELDFYDEVSGKIIKNSQKSTSDGKENFTIIVQQKEPLVRQRFTIAHELAHFLLHKKKIGNGITEDTLYRSQNKEIKSFMETKANHLAADILMPFTLIQTIEEQYRYPFGKDSWRDLPLKKMARALEVSVLALKIRLGIPTE